jgi:hypothetical protein
MEKNIGFNIIDSPEWESVIECVTSIEAQKHLNQWRHEYHIIVLACLPWGQDANFPKTYMSILRKKKG